MRLIDADKLIDKVSNLHFCSASGVAVQRILLKEIKKQPTAYDVDKVTEQLEELKTVDACDFDNCPDVDMHCDECIQFRIINQAIEIVKAGGIDA